MAAESPEVTDGLSDPAGARHISPHSRRRNALCTTVSLSTLTLAIVALVWMLWPHPEQVQVVDRFVEQASRPMDTVIMLDASGSMSAGDWRREVEFASRLALLLEQSFSKQNATFRAALGQFSTSAHVEIELTADVKARFGNLSTWQCSQRWDDMCDTDDGKRGCLQNESCIVRRRGFTEIGAALCGANFSSSRSTQFPTAESCTGGAMEQLRQNDTPDSYDGDQGAPSNLDCEDEVCNYSEPANLDCENEVLKKPLKSILLVTDGRPTAPGCPRSKGHCGAANFVKGAQDAASAAKIVKLTNWNASGAPHVFGVMVGSKKDAKQLQSLTSCCDANDTVWGFRDRVACASEIAPNCSYYKFVDDFNSLLRSVSSVVESLAQSHRVNCIHHVTYTKSSSVTVPWLLLLLAALPLLIAASWLVVSHSRSRRGVIQHHVIENSLRTPCIDDPALMEARETEPSSMPVTRNVPRFLDPPLVEVIETDCSPQPNSDAPAEEVIETDCSPQPSSDAPAEVGGSSSTEPSTMTAERKNEKKQSDGRKWEPIRSAYLVNGKRLDVDYGAGKPPSAPNSSRKGTEPQSPDDVPETALPFLPVTVQFEHPPTEN